MTVRDAFKNQDAIMAQHRAIGVPSEAELQASPNAVYVHAYVKDDGTQVRAHWRSLPDGNQKSNLKMTNNITINNKVNSLLPTNNDNNLPIKKNAEVLNNNLIDDKITYINDFYVKNNSDLSNEIKEIAGVKPGKKMSFKEADGMSVNPNYYSDNIGYKLNCLSCVAVYEARLRGYNIEALPLQKDANYIVKFMYKHPFFAFSSYNNEKMTGRITLRSENKEECWRNLEANIKPNERYMIMYQSKENPEQFGHIIEVWRTPNGNIQFYDPQLGKLYGQELLETIKFTKYINEEKKYFTQELMRVDDKDLNYEFLNLVAKPSYKQP